MSSFNKFWFHPKLRNSPSIFIDLLPCDYSVGGVRIDCGAFSGHPLVFFNLIFNHKLYHLKYEKVLFCVIINYILQGNN